MLRRTDLFPWGNMGVRSRGFRASVESLRTFITTLLAKRVRLALGLEFADSVTSCVSEVQCPSRQSPHVTAWIPVTHTPTAPLLKPVLTSLCGLMESFDMLKC